MSCAWLAGRQIHHANVQPAHAYYIQATASHDAFCLIPYFTTGPRKFTEQMTIFRRNSLRICTKRFDLLCAPRYR